MIASATVRAGQVLALAIAVAAAIWLAELWLVAVVLVVDAFVDRQIFAIAAPLAFCGLLGLCIAGSRMQGHPVIYFVTRAILLLLSAVAGVASTELILFGLAALGAGIEQASLQDYAWLIGGPVLAAAAAAGVKYVFDWKIAYWIVFLSVLVAVIVAIVVSQAGVLFS